MNDPTSVVYAFERRSASERILCVLNLSDEERRDYVVDAGGATRAKMLLNTDWTRFSGSTPADDCRWFKLLGGRLTCTLAPFSGLLLQLD